MASRQERFGRSFPASPDDLFAAFREAVERGRYRKPRVDAFSRSIDFETAAGLSPALPVQGQVTADGDGARLVLLVSVNTWTMGGNDRASKKMGDLLADVSARCAKAVA